MSAAGPGYDFLTVTADALRAAQQLAEFFEDHGCEIRIEPRDVAFPRTPTFVAAAPDDVTTVVEVLSKLDQAQLRMTKDWATYAAHAGVPTHVVLCVPQEGNSGEAPDAMVTEVARLDFGLFVVRDDEVIEVRPGKDLSTPTKLPPLRGNPKDVKRALGPAWREFEKDWHKGFESATIALQDAARALLVDLLRADPMSVLKTDGKPFKGLSPDKAMTLTFGPLINAFEGIVKPLPKHDALLQAMKRVNPARTTAAHEAGKTKIKNEVGMHMLAIFNAVKQAYTP